MPLHGQRPGRLVNFRAAVGGDAVQDWTEVLACWQSLPRLQALDRLRSLCQDTKAALLYRLQCRQRTTIRRSYFFFFFSFIRFDQVSLPQGLCSKEISELKTGRHRNMEERQTELVLQRDHPTQRRFRLTATEQGQASEADPSDHGAHGGRAMSGDQKWHQEGEAEGSCGLSLFRKKSGANSKCYQVVTFVSNAERGKGVWDRAEPLVQDFSKLIFKVTDIHE